MQLKTIHIVSLDIPIPADYGGIIDIFYRAKALRSAGIRVILHCFEYGRSTEQDFSEIADEVFFYNRKKSVLSLFSSSPFIVSSRKSEELVATLLKDDFPILLEGHHCSGLLNDSRLDNRKKYVRIHNIEWKYYEALSESTNSLWRKLFFKWESKKLKKFDTVLSKANGLFCLSNTELEYYKKINPKSFLWSIGCNLERGKEMSIQNFALFHGNLSVSENENALLWLIDIWKKNKIELPLVVAGKNPSDKLKSLLQNSKNIQLQPNPNDEEMSKLIGTAKTNLLVTFQSTGAKLKLINALVKGNRCIVNPQMVEGTDLGQFCEVFQNENDLVQILKENSDFTPQNLEERNRFLTQNYDILKNAKKTVEIIEQ